LTATSAFIAPSPEWPANHARAPSQGKTRDAVA
jgi:hypothetical protein